MPKRLIIMRHAKSDWSTHAATDHARPLNKRGRRDAPRIGARIAELGWQPDAVVSSDSQRTRETFERMADAFAPDLVVDFRSSLYHAGPAELSEVLWTTDDAHQCVLALGHNPGWQETVRWLCGKSISMTTANAALLEIDTGSWREGLQRAGHWELVNVLRPKELTGEN